MFPKKKAAVTEDISVKSGDAFAPLLEKFKVEVDEVLGEVAEAIKTCPDVGLEMDELFVLRYLLDASLDKTKAVENIKAGILWRSENKELLKTIQKRADGTGYVFGVEGSPEANHFKFLTENIVSGLISSDESLDIIVQCNRPNHSKQKTTLKQVPTETIVLWATMNNESYFRLCDERSRDSGKLIRILGIIDFKGFSPMGKESDMKFLKTVGKAGDVADALHPLLFQKRVSNCVSTALSMAMGAMRKMTKGGSDMVLWKDVAIKAPEVKELKVESVLPPFLGGTAPCPEYFIKDPADGKPAELKV